MPDLKNIEERPTEDSQHTTGVAYTAEPFMKKTIAKKRTTYRVTVIKTVEIIVETHDTVWEHVRSGVQISTSDYLTMSPFYQGDYKPKQELTRRTVEREDVRRITEVPVYRRTKVLKSTR